MQAALIVAPMVALVVFWLLAQVPVVVAALALMTFLLTVTPGIGLMERLCPGRGFANLAFGGVLGLLLCRLILFVVFSTTYEIGSAALTATIVLAALTVSQWSKARSVVATADRRQLAIVCAFVSIVVFSLALPYSRIGVESPAGHVFLPYFTKDFFNHVSVVVELVRGGAPENPYLSGAALHYYWFSHVWPAALMEATGTTAQQALSATIPLTVGVFVACLAVLVWNGVSVSIRSTAAIGVGLFAYSYIGWLFLGQEAWNGLHRNLPGQSPLPYSFLGHGWYRDFLYEPHAVAALGNLMLATYLVTTVRGPGWRTALVCGAAIGSSLLTDSFLGLVSTAWFVLYSALLWWYGRWSLTNALVATGTIGIFLGAGFAVAIFPVGGQPLGFGLHPLTWILPGYLSVELGPLFAVALVGGYVAWQQRAEWTLVYFVLALVAVVFAVVVRMPMDGDVALRKTTKILMISGVMFTAVALAHDNWARFQRVSLALLCAAGLTTFASDFYQHFALNGSRFPGPILVSADSVRAYTWIRLNTPSHWSVQRLDEVRPGRKFPATSFTVLPGLTERRALFANYELPYLFQVPVAEIEQRRDTLLRVFGATSPDQMADAMRDLPEHVLVVEDRTPGPTGMVRAAVDAGRLSELFRSGGVSVVSVSTLP